MNVKSIFKIAAILNLFFQIFTIIALFFELSNKIAVQLKRVEFKMMKK